MSEEVIEQATAAPGEQRNVRKFGRTFGADNVYEAFESFMRDIDTDLIEIRITRVAPGVYRCRADGE